MRKFIPFLLFAEQKSNTNINSSNVYKKFRTIHCYLKWFNIKYLFSIILNNQPYMYIEQDFKNVQTDQIFYILSKVKS